MRQQFYSKGVLDFKSPFFWFELILKLADSGSSKESYNLVKFHGVVELLKLVLLKSNESYYLIFLASDSFTPDRKQYFYGTLASIIIAVILVMILFVKNSNVFRFKIVPTKKQDHFKE